MSWEISRKPIHARGQLASVRFTGLTPENSKSFLWFLEMVHIHAATLHETLMEVHTKSRLCRLLPCDIVQTIQPTMAQTKPSCNKTPQQTRLTHVTILLACQYQNYLPKSKHQPIHDRNLSKLHRRAAPSNVTQVGPVTSHHLLRRCHDMCMCMNVLMSTNCLCQVHMHV